MKRISALTIAVLALAGLTSRIGAQAPDHASPKLRVEWTEFKKLYEAKQAVVVDVRDAASFEAGHIPGALSVPLDEVEQRAGELKKLGKPILTYCA
jgi:3-mercaptopyruvate sulfurtransferase SseA